MKADNWFFYGDGKPMPPRGYIEREIDNFVLARLRLMTQFQRFELRWPKSSETRFCVQPEIWTYLGENGEILDQRIKRLHRQAHFVYVKENGELDKRVDGHKNGKTEWE
jgi:hypothetical protein